MIICNDRAAFLGHLCLGLCAVALGAVVWLVVFGSSVDAQVGRFDDVAVDAYYATAVGELDDMGVFEGTVLDGSMCSEGFCPSVPVDRKTVAVWVVRILDGQDPPVKSSRFDDVDCCLDEFWPPFVERMAELGVTRGCGDGSGFCPNEDTTRAEMAAFLSRAFDLSDGPAPGFDDVADDAWYLADVARLRAAGITQGCGDGTNFCPNRVTTRAEMATFLYRGLTGDTGFDPRRTPTVTGVDLDKIIHVADNLDLDKPCFSIEPPVTSDQIVEILRFVDSCLFVDYEVLGDRTLQEVRNQYAAESSVIAIDFPAEIFLDQSDGSAGENYENEQWHLPYLDAYALQDQWPTKARVRVAVIDTGVDSNHKDLDSNIAKFTLAKSRRFAYRTRIPSTIVVSHCLTYVDTDNRLGDSDCKFVEKLSLGIHGQDPSGHGTHVAGIIAAEASNGGVRGVAPSAGILPIAGCCLDPDDDDPWDNVRTSEALLLALYERVDIINMSFAWGSPTQLAEAMLRIADLRDILVVTTAGNCGSDKEISIRNEEGKLQTKESWKWNKCGHHDQIRWPAKYPGSIVVANTTKSSSLAATSSKGNEVTIAAPGTGILSTVAGVAAEAGSSYKPKGQRGAKYGTTSGTSMAAPMVSGVLAHLIARFPDAPPELLKIALYQTADHPNGKRKDKEYGYGIIKPLDAIKWLERWQRGSTDPLDDISVGGRHACWIEADKTITCKGDKDYKQSDPPSGSFISVSSGDTHSCAVNTDYKVKCWGNPSDGRTKHLKNDYVTVAAGSSHNCGIDHKGKVYCWGNGDDRRRDVWPRFGGWFNRNSVRRFVSVSAGAKHSCGLIDDKKVRCWGDDTDNKASAPTHDFIDVAAGGNHSCGVRTTNKIVCWGDNNEGQAPKTASGSQYTAVAAGGQHTCGLTSNQTIHCWGNNDHNQVKPIASGKYLAVAAGKHDTCARKTNNEVICWGKNADKLNFDPTETSTLRRPPTTSTPLPTKPTSTPTFKSVSAGGLHSCAVRSDNTITCWGRNDYGQSVAPSGMFKSVSAGEYHSCGVRSDNTITCWGDNEYGQSVAPSGVFKSVSAGEHDSCGVRSDNTITCWGRNDFRESVAPSGVFKSVSAGRGISCGVRSDNTITCWGRNVYGQSVAPSGMFKSVSAGWGSSCGVRSDNTITCWGDNSHGRSVAPSGVFKSVSAGGLHSCGVRSDNTITCWGRNEYGQSVAPSGMFKSVSIGGFYSCGVRSDNTITCWGDNSHGQSVAPSDMFKSVSIGGLHSCGVRSDNTITCWGIGFGEAVAPSGMFKSVSAGWGSSCGVRSDNTITCWGSGYREAVAPSGMFKSVSIGGFYSCGVRSDNTITCWGDNSHGQSVAPSGMFKSVSAGWESSCGVRSDNTITCWGRNEYGQSVAPSGMFKSVSAGEYHSCGVRSDNTITCWGDNSHGQSVAPSGMFKSVSAGWESSCGVRSDNTITCWGRNDYGQSVAPSGVFKSVSAGWGTWCGVRSDNTIICW